MAQKRIAICNQKGGVAKTTTAVNLAVLFAQRGKRVLLVDYDPQGNASQFLGLTDELEDENLYSAAHLTLGNRPFAPQRNCAVPGLDLVPATDSLAALEFELLQDSRQGAHRLGLALNAVAQDYEVVIVDSPPTLGMLAINALVGCSNVLIPVKLSPASVPGAVRLHHTLEALRNTNPYLKVIGVVGTFLNEAAKAPREVLAQLRELFGASVVLETAIHAAQGVDDAAGKGKPVVLTAPRSRGAQEYNSLAEEVISRV
jgi:chromosome partitioning protein